MLGGLLLALGDDLLGGLGRVTERRISAYWRDLGVAVWLSATMGCWQTDQQQAGAASDDVRPTTSTQSPARA